MTKNQYIFLSSFQDRLIQPILDKLDSDQQRQHPIVHDDPFQLELANIIRSLKIVTTSHVSFRVEFVCKGNHVVASVKKNHQSHSSLEHILWELCVILQLAELKHISFPARRELPLLRKGIESVLQIVRPEVYGQWSGF